MMFIYLWKLIEINFENIISILGWICLFIIFLILAFWALVYIFAPDYSQIEWCSKCNSDIDINNICQCKKKT